MINYDSWNLRFIPIYKEEVIDCDNDQYQSIINFTNDFLYSKVEREKIIRYLESCVPLIRTSFKRVNPYTMEIGFDLCFYTDGEVIFNNFLIDYIAKSNFILPSKWYNILKEKDFIMEKLVLDMSFLEDQVDIFQMSEQTFLDFPLIKPYLKPLGDSLPR